MISLASAASYTYKQDDTIDYRFRCIDLNGDYCPNTVFVGLSLDHPNGSTIYDNSTMTSNPTYYNHTLPTSDVGTYSVFIIAPSINSTTEFTYDVTPSGASDPNMAQGLIILGSLVVIILVGYYGFHVGEHTESTFLRFGGYAFGAIFAGVAILYSTILLQQLTGGFSTVVVGFENFWFVVKMIYTAALLAFVILIFLFVLRLWKIKRGFIDK